MGVAPGQLTWASGQKLHLWTTSVASAFAFRTKLAFKLTNNEK